MADRTRAVVRCGGGTWEVPQISGPPRPRPVEYLRVLDKGRLLIERFSRRIPEVTSSYVCCDLFTLNFCNGFQLLFFFVRTKTKPTHFNFIKI